MSVILRLINASHKQCIPFLWVDHSLPTARLGLYDSTCLNSIIAGSVCVLPFFYIAECAALTLSARPCRNSICEFGAFYLHFGLHLVL